VNDGPARRSEWLGRLAEGLFVLAAFVVTTILFDVPDYFLTKWSIGRAVRSNPAGVEDLGRLSLQLLWIAGATLATLGIVSAIVLLTSRWRRPRVFISYHLEDGELAQSIRHFFERNGVHAYVDPPQQGRHDDVVKRVRAQLLASDLVVSIPGSRGDFVDAELFLAAAHNLPILLLSRGAEDMLPNTIVSGYITFDYPRLHDQELVPLADFIRFALNHAGYVGRMLGRATGFSNRLPPPVILIPSVIVTIVGYVSFVIAGWVSLLLILLLFAGSCVVFVGVVSSRIWSRVKTDRIARQIIETSDGTMAAIARYLPHELEHVLRYIKAQPLRRRSESRDSAAPA